ncbi:MAG: CBS domain-containing protein [Polyangiaceae bacterium]
MVLDAAKRMVETGTHRLVVVDADGHLVGIVTPMDVLRRCVTRGGNLA